MGKINRISSLIAVLSLMSLSFCGCAEHVVKVADAEVETKWLGFLEDGSITKQDVLLKLGLPAENFEGERILVYRLVLTENEGLVNLSRYIHQYEPLMDEGPGTKGHFSLVLVFDDNHVLKRHSLLRLR